MKKIIYSLLITFSIFSCKDDDVKPNNKRTLCTIQQTSSFYENQPFAEFRYNFIYESDKLVKLIESDLFGYIDSILYIYNSSNQLTFVLEHITSNVKFDTTEEYVYNQNNQLIKALFLDQGVATGTLTFTYNNGVLSQMFAEYTHSDSERYSIKMNGGNISEFNWIDSNGRSSQQDKIVLEYDNGYNPFQFFPNEGFNPFLYFSNRNLTSASYYESGKLEYFVTYKYKYNLFQYPIQITEEYADGDTLITDISYLCE